MSEELKPCPFCGEIPSLPDGNGTQYEIWCDCGLACSTVQISDFMTIGERLHSDFTHRNYRYEQEYINRAMEEAIKNWNTRFITEE